MAFDFILLAAGDSKRFGTNKLLHEINGKEMYRNILDAILALPEEMIGKIILVTQYEEILNNIQKSPVIGVKNDRSDLGISHSIKLGISALENMGLADNPCLFTVCDQPYVKTETLKQFMHSYCLSQKTIGAFAKEEQIGNPVIFSRAYFDELKRLTEDTGGKKILLAHRDAVYLHQVEEIELQDYDKKTDLAYENI
jgi:molybdenum cofactor cytidylyltransferase